MCSLLFWLSTDVLCIIYCVVTCYGWCLKNVFNILVLLLVAVKSLLAIWFGYIMLYFYVVGCCLGFFTKQLVKWETIAEKHHVNAIYFILYLFKRLSFHNNKLNHYHLLLTSMIDNHVTIINYLLLFFFFCFFIHPPSYWYTMVFFCFVLCMTSRKNRKNISSYYIKTKNKTKKNLTRSKSRYGERKVQFSFIVGFYRCYKNPQHWYKHYFLCFPGNNRIRASF